MILFLLLIGIIVFVDYGSRTPFGKKIGNVLPTPFWIYFIPILLATFGLLPQETSAFKMINVRALPAALVLMLIGTSLPALAKLGGVSAKAMAIAAGSMFIATFTAFILTQWMLPDWAYKGAGALLATWTGGSINMIAVKEILSITDADLAPLIVVDTILSYLWMAMLILAAGFQKFFDRGVATIADSPQEKISATEPKKFSVNRWLILTALSFVVAELCLRTGGQLFKLSPLLPERGWAVLIASLAAVALAATPARRLELWSASRLGTYVLYFVLAAIGSKSSLTAAITMPGFFVFGALVLIIHGALSLLLGRVMKVPFYLLAIASQANVGGAVSAPIVAAVYRPDLAHIGVLMAVLGTLIGTYVGLLGAWTCRLVSG